MKHCKTTKGKGKRSHCRDICYQHAKHRACNNCHTLKCRKARSVCYSSLQACKAKSKTVQAKALCRCHKPKKVVPIKAVAAKKPKKVAPKKHKCPRGSKGYKCRRNRRCARRHHRCRTVWCVRKGHKGRDCTDRCYKHMKHRACNTCNDKKCRGDRKVCFTDVKMCEAKCNSLKCRTHCRCHPHKPKPKTQKPSAKPVAKPKKVAKKPVVAKVVHPSKPICTCHRRQKKCTYHKKCDLRQERKVKQCVDKALSRVVYCQCELHDPVSGKCTKKKTRKTCVEKKAGKCLKYEDRCVPVCKKEKCLKSSVGADGKQHCVESICTQEDASESMRCSKYKEEPEYKCASAGYSHICKWECSETKCTHPETKETAHAFGYSSHLKGSETHVKVYNAQGKQMTTVQLAVLAKADPSAFKNIVHAMDEAGQNAKSKKQLEAITKEKVLLHRMELGAGRH